MDDSDAANKAKSLRDLAASLLQDAARCTESARRDALLNEALVRLNEARVLLDQADAEAASRGAIHSTARTH
jgi:hypothetical protein